VVRVIDGDTVELDVDLGFGVTLTRQSFRLAGCNARELHDPGGGEARAHLTGCLPSGAKVLLSSVRNDKYGGRYDACLYLTDGTDLVAKLIGLGWLARWDGTGTAPKPAWPIPAAPAAGL
jgi:endonuclease YncB( thermonuclease family)